MVNPQRILDDCGLLSASVVPVHGGDINQAYCVSGGGAKYFLKVNDAKLYPGMFEKEARGLAALHDKTGLVVPGILKVGNLDQQQYLVMEWMEPGKPATNFWENFGSLLAGLHRQKQEYFGWEEDNYIGSLPQVNTIADSWPLFFADCRIMPLVRRLFDENSFSKRDITTAEILCKKLDQLFPGEPPALLHGDLWSGNYMVAANGHAAVYDPAVYFGHREMDIGMTSLFGGFDQRFYTAYDEAFPLETGWRERLQLTQLYPLLVHALLFGGHYISNAKEVMTRYAWAP